MVSRDHGQGKLYNQNMECITTLCLASNNGMVTPWIPLGPIHIDTCHFVGYSLGKIMKS